MSAPNSIVNNPFQTKTSGNTPIAFIDMDGVLCDLYKSFMSEILNQRLGIKFDDPYQDKNNWGKSIYSVTVQPSIFFQLINYCEFWSNLPWTVDGKEILEKIEHAFGKENCVILSAPTRNNSCFGKMDWLRKHLPEYMENRRFIFTKHKYLCAGKDRYLFDDDPENLRNFITFDGTSILIKRPWNYQCKFEHIISTENKITNLLEYFSKKEVVW